MLARSSRTGTITATEGVTAFGLAALSATRPNSLRWR